MPEVRQILYPRNFYSGADQHTQWVSAIGTGDAPLTNNPQILLSGVPAALKTSLAHPIPEYRIAIPSGNSGAVTSVIRDADCFEQMTGTEPSKPVMYCKKQEICSQYKCFQFVNRFVN